MGLVLPLQESSGITYRTCSIWMSEISELRFMVSLAHISMLVSGPQQEKTMKQGENLPVEYPFHAVPLNIN